MLAGILRWLRGLFRREADLFHLEIEATYAIRASRRNPYFQALERQARDAGFLGGFVVGQDGRLRPGPPREGLDRLHATLALDVYPNPAAVESRSVVDYDAADLPRRQPRARVVLDDDSELFLWLDGKTLRVSGEALTRAQDALQRR